MQTNLATARLMLIVLGMWLFFSAFFWSYGAVPRANTAISGLVCAGAAILLVRVPQIRYLVALLAIHVFVSSWLLPGSLGALLINVLAATAIFFTAVLPGYVRNAPTRIIHL